MTQKQSVANLIISWLLRVKCSGSISWFPYWRKGRAWRPVLWDLSVLSDMSVDIHVFICRLRRVGGLAVERGNHCPPDRPHRTVVCNRYSVSRTLLPNICKAVRMVNEFPHWRTGYLLANCFQDLRSNLRMHFLFNLVTHQMFLSRLQMF